MMLTIFAAALLLTATSASPAFSRGVTPSIVFSLPRGGGLFGGGKDKTATKAAAAVAAGDGSSYPAMSTQEVEEWLDHVPVFAVTDAKGQGVVLRPDENSSVFYFFMSPLMANATLNQLKESETATGMELRVSAFSLGKIWFNILNNENKEVLLKAPGSEEGAPSKDVEYRLVPDTRDLLGARMLLTMNPEDGEKLKSGEQMTPELAQAALKKAMTESPKFNATFNEIPVFLIAQMRMQKEMEEEVGEPVTLMPMYFSLQNMIATWQQFMQGAPTDMQTMEPAINLMGLHDLVEMMQKECPIDFRNVVLVPPTPVADGAGPGAGATAEPAMGGGTSLGDL